MRVSTRQLATAPSKLASQAAANDWWSKKLIEIESNAPSPNLIDDPSYATAMGQLEKMLAWYRQEGLEEDIQRVTMQIKALKNASKI